MSRPMLCERCGRPIPEGQGIETDLGAVCTFQPGEDSCAVIVVREYIAGLSEPLSLEQFRAVVKARQIELGIINPDGTPRIPPGTTATIDG